MGSRVLITAGGIRCTPLALSYALHLWCIQRINFWFGVSVQVPPSDNARLS